MCCACGHQSIKIRLLLSRILVYKCGRFNYFFLYYRSVVEVFFCLSLLCLLCVLLFLCLCSVFFSTDLCGLN